ncbi:MAG: type II toxin-antitoxin system RelE/ParE family toxin [Candidatus Gracilibacteria bacterium]|nr:type II toxin-antitoxin system RelE/ParE family toxin [Candidatus Gracilibacteria bacterium]MDQ7022201.1 type II toxin-antitoxin system RelE/ParE family toxin [Candidatus Gracilibacteria bacterium]
MFYNIELKDQAKKDIFELTDYIFRFSFSKDISDKIYDEIYKKIFSLEFFPEKFQKVLGDYRVALVKKTYRIFYRIEEENKKVIIIRIIRTDQNIEEILFD